MKKWILQLPFVKTYIKEKIDDAAIEFHLKNFKSAQTDILETMRDDLDKQANVLADQKVSNLLSNVDFNKVISADKTKGFVYIGGDKADPARLNNLKAEADFLMESDIWKLLYETPKELAQRTMFIYSESLDDMKKGKSILFTLSQQQNIINLLRNVRTMGQ